MEDQTITKYLKLPFQFDKVRLTDELNHLVMANWIPHFNKNGYSGSWNAISLYAIEGNQENILAFNINNSPIKQTPILDQCRYLKEVICHFKCPLLSVRLLRLSPGSIIKPHRDLELGYENNCFRLHIPIITNSNVTFILANNKIDMLPGECWYTNVNYIHSVSNKGVTDRIHLVIDGQRNEWSDDLFFSLVPKESLLTSEKQIHDSTTIKKMILELERIKSPRANELIEELQVQLNQL